MGAVARDLVALACADELGSGGKTVDEIKAMHVLEKKKHADLCNKNRSISAQSVTELATKMACPSDYTTKLSKLGWIFLQLQA